MTGVIEVYNMLGVLMASSPAKGNSLNKITMNCNSGYYIVKVTGDQVTCSGKVFIN